MKSSAQFRLVQVREGDWPRESRARTHQPLRVWCSPVFQVTLWLERSGQLRLSINRLERAKQFTYADGISWDELQQLKSAAGFGTWQAVEIYPPDADVVYKANVRHLWLMHEPVKFQWRKKSATSARR